MKSRSVHDEITSAYATLATQVPKFPPLHPMLHWLDCSLGSLLGFDPGGIQLLIVDVVLGGLSGRNTSLELASMLATSATSAREAMITYHVVKLAKGAVFSFEESEVAPD